MKSVKRIFGVGDGAKKFFSMIEAESTAFGATVKISSTKIKDIESLTFSNGVNFEKCAVNEVIALHFDISEGLVAKFVVGGKALFGGSFKGGIDIEKQFIGYEKNNENEKESKITKAADAFYDDEQIADENYFEIEDESEKNRDHKDDDAQGKRQKEQEKSELDLRPFEDDEDRFFYKEQNGASCGDAAGKQRREAFYERRDKKEDGGIEKLLSLFPEELPLKRLVGGRFARVNDPSGKTFVVGKIKAQGKTYELAGVDGVFDSPPDSFEDWFFFPKSPFSLRGEGYYMIITNETGERIPRAKKVFD